MTKHVDVATLKARPVNTTVKTINLALQGGGAHGAFTWGVLDRLLEEESLQFEGISATSAGAMNATVMAYGMTVGGREGAKKALRDFWRRISHAALFSPLQPSLFDRLTHNHGLENSPAHLVFDILTRLLSPYQLNPLNHNPLRQPLEAVVDFERLNRGSAIKLFLSATNVRTCKVRIFTCAEVTADAVLASACLPFIGDDLVPLLDRELVDRSDVLDTGVVDEDVEPPEGFERQIDHASDRAGLCHVGRRIDRPYAVLRRVPATVSPTSSILPRPLSTTAAPASASERAMPSPMPLVEPVTIATRPASCFAASGAGRASSINIVVLL
jgi:hypothetical protein